MATAAVLALALVLAACGKSESGSEPSAQLPTAASPADTAPAPPAATAPSTPQTTPQTRPGTGSAGTGAAAGVAPAHPVPAAFRPAPGAPSDQQVREELETMRALQRAEYRRTLSAAAANLAGLLPWTLEPKSGTQISVASDFTDYGLGLACGGLLGRHQLGVAHKTAPCGTLITFTYDGRSITVPVIDRGPYIAGREWDLTGATAEALHFPGLARIEWSVAG